MAIRFGKRRMHPFKMLFLLLNIGFFIILYQQRKSPDDSGIQRKESLSEPVPTLKTPTATSQTLTTTTAQASEDLYELWKDHIPSFETLYSKTRDKLVTYQDVCIPPPQRKIKDICDPPKRSLIIYNADANRTRYIHGHDVIFSTLEIPESYKVHENMTAIFNGYNNNATSKYDGFYISNLGHFTDLTYLPTYYAYLVAKYLKLPQKFALFFAASAVPCARSPYFEPFFATIENTDGKEYAYNYHSHPGNVCFKFAILTVEKYKSHKSLAYAINALYKTHNISLKNCPPNDILFMNRLRTRKIVNIEELKLMTENEGYRTSVMSFETMSVKEQLQATVCTRVMVGAIGAGLTWAYFMRPNTSLIEIAWTKFGWHKYFYKKYMSIFSPVNFYLLELDKVTDIQDYHKCSMSRLRNMLQRQGSSESEILDAMKRDPLDLVNIYPDLHIGKNCAIKVDPYQIIDILKKQIQI